jgi:hypothetical protein
VLARFRPAHNHSPSSKRGITPRSTGAPTAGHQRPVGGTRYIFTARALASCRRRPVTSNVRPRMQPVPYWLVSTYGSATPATSRRPAIPNSLRVSRQRLTPSAFAGPRRAALADKSCRLHEALCRLNEVVALGGFVTEGQDHKVHGNLKPRQLLPLPAEASRLAQSTRSQSSRGLAAAARAERAEESRVHWFKGAGVRQPSRRPRPNPSLKRSTNGGPPGPVWRYAVHFRQTGPGVPPLAPA